MIQHILEQETAIRQVLGGDRRTSHSIPFWQDIDVLESLNKAPHPLKDFIHILSAEGYVTVSVLHHLTIVHMVLMPLEKDTHLIKDIMMVTLRIQTQTHIHHQPKSSSWVAELN